MAVISSCTPEGDPLGCPVCHKHADVEFSTFPVADATCPHCNSLSVPAWDPDRVSWADVISQKLREWREKNATEPPARVTPASSPCGMADYWREMGWAADAKPAPKPSLKLCEVRE